MRSSFIRTDQRTNLATSLSVPNLPSDSSSNAPLNNGGASEMGRIDVSNLLVVGVVFPLPGSQKVIHDKVGYFAAQALAGSQVEVEMLPAEDSAQCGFFCRSGDTCEGTFNSRENFRRNSEIGIVSLEKGNQHLCSGSAYHPMSARIRWVGSSFADLREPIRISHRFRI